MLRMIGFGENVGSGFPKIIAAWKETDWGEPQLLNKFDLDEVELVLPVPSTKAVRAADELSKGLTDGLPKGLSETAAKILKLIYLDNYISREALAEKLAFQLLQYRIMSTN